MSIKILSVPPKSLTKSISSTASSFKLSNIKSWKKDSNGAFINLAASDFGTTAYGCFRNATGTILEIFEFDPSTIADASVTLNKRGLSFDGDLSTETTAFKLDWSAGTVVQIGTDIPQLLLQIRRMINYNTIVSSGTPTTNVDLYDTITITALAENITSMTTNLTGTPVNFQKLTFRIKDNGTARAITWGASFVAMGVNLPTTTVISKILTVGFIYNTVTATWGCLAKTQEI